MACCPLSDAHASGAIGRHRPPGGDAFAQCDRRARIYLHPAWAAGPTRAGRPRSNPHGHRNSGFPDPAAGLPDPRVHGKGKYLAFRGFRTPVPGGQSHGSPGSRRTRMNQSVGPTLRATARERCGTLLRRREEALAAASHHGRHSQAKRSVGARAGRLPGRPLIVG